MPPQQEITEPFNDHQGDQHDSGQHEHGNTMVEIDPHERVPRPSVYRHDSFIMHFATSNGPPQIVFLCLLLALGFGSTIGVVPAVITDRYARLNHGYDDEQNCADFTSVNEKPAACIAGSQDAQNTAALASLVSNTLTFISSSLMGSLSDESGRKGILVLGLLLACLTPMNLVLLQLIPKMSPNWYYGTHAVSGVVNWIAVALSALSDVMPSKWRAASFGLLLAGFSLGFAFSPMLALALNHFQVSVFSLLTVGVGFLITVFFLPETLPPEVKLEAARRRLIEDVDNEDDTKLQSFIRMITRPLRELSILNRNRLFRMLSALAFFSGMVSSADQTLFIYYMEERLAFNDQDVALVFVLMGVLGILVQGLLIKPINDCIGEQMVIVVAFLFGALNNFLYGIAANKTTVFVAVCLGSLTGMSFPTISAIKSNNVNESEQGRIQGALYSLQALASGVGPVSLRLVYHHTKDLPWPGPGSMFIFASFLMLLAVACAWKLPKDQANSRKAGEQEICPILRESDDESRSDSSYGTALLS